VVEKTARKNLLCPDTSESKRQGHDPKHSEQQKAKSTSKKTGFLEHSFLDQVFETRFETGNCDSLGAPGLLKSRATDINKERRFQPSPGLLQAPNHGIRTPFFPYSQQRSPSR
jgi:hypothetical protein